MSGAVFFLKSTTISTVLRALSSKLFWLHQVVSFPPVIGLVPVRDEPNKGGVVRKLQKFDRRMTGSAAVGVQGEEQRGKDAALRRSGADGPRDKDLCSHFNVLLLSDRKYVIHLQVESGTFSWESFS